MQSRKTPKWEVEQVKKHFSEIPDKEFADLLEEVLEVLLNQGLSTDGLAPKTEEIA